MNELANLLKDTHILIFMNDPYIRSKLTKLLEATHATVHYAPSQMTAIGMYYKLFKQGIRPRAVITCWDLNAPNSAEQKFLELIRQEKDGTAFNLLYEIYDLDPSAFLSVYDCNLSGSLDKARILLEQKSVPAYVIDQNTMDIPSFVASIVTHENISKQRTPSENIIRFHMESLNREIESGIYPVMNTLRPNYKSA